MKFDKTISLVTDLLSRIPGADLNSWRDPGQDRYTANEPIEFRLAITAPRALAILAHVAERAGSLLKVIISDDRPQHFEDPKRVRYALCVYMTPVDKDRPNPLEFFGSMLACRLRDTGLVQQTEIDPLLHAWKTELPTVDILVATLDHDNPGDLCRHWALHGFVALIPGLVAAYPRIRNWHGRNSILFEMMCYARKRPEIVELARLALQDSAYMVRYQACTVLAYSLRRDCIPSLEPLLKHKDKKTRAAAAAAIDNIQRQKFDQFTVVAAPHLDPI